MRFISYYLFLIEMIGDWCSIHATDFSAYYDQLIALLCLCLSLSVQHLAVSKKQKGSSVLLGFIIRMDIVSGCCLHSSLWCHSHLLSIHCKIFNWFNLLLLFVFFSSLFPSLVRYLFFIFSSSLHLSVGLSSHLLFAMQLIFDYYYSIERKVSIVHKVQK